MRRAMHEKTIESIESLVQEKRALLAEIQAPTDYASLKEQVLLAELHAEIEALSNLLETPDTFEDAFKDRCVLRAENPDQCISFDKLPTSPVNRLYWEIATILFKPPTLQAMLAILLPGVKSLVTVFVPDRLPEKVKTLKELRDHVRNQPFDVGETNLDVSPDVLNLGDVPSTHSLETLLHYVSTAKQLFDVRDIGEFPLAVHASLHRALHEKYPALAKRLYTHNAALNQLEEDILEFQNKGRTPRSALTTLKKAFILGGTKMTSKAWAGVQTERAAEHFMDYFKELPEPLQNALNDLPAFKNIFKNIQAGECVETTGEAISKFLQEHDKNPLLDTIPNMTKEAYKALVTRYKSSLDTAKDTSFPLNFPPKLAESIIKNIQIDQSEDLINLILNFPPDTYDLLLKHIQFKNPLNPHLPNIAVAMREGFFEPDQLERLAKAIINHYKRFDSSGSVLSWAVQTNHSKVLQLAIDSIPLSQLFEVFKKKKDDGKMMLHAAADKPEFLRAILTPLSEEERFKAVTTGDNFGRTVLHAAADKPESLRAILALLSNDEQRFKAVTTLNKFLESVLHAAADKPESLKILLPICPPERLFDAVTTADNYGWTVMVSAAYKPKSLRAILAQLPNDKRFDAVTAGDKNTQTVLHAAVYSLKSLQTILKLFEDKDKLFDAVTRADENGKTVLHVAKNNPESLRAILAQLSEEQRFKAVITVDGEGGTVLHAAVINPESLRVIFELFEDKDKLFDAVRKKNDDGKTVLHYAADSPESLRAILALLPENKRPDAVTKKNADGKIGRAHVS